MSERTELRVMVGVVAFAVLYFGGHLVHALIWGAWS